MVGLPTASAIASDGIALTGGRVLNTTAVARAKPKDAEYRLSDRDGLFLLVTPAGGKLWRYNYRHGGAQKTLSYGKYPGVSFEAARSLHAVARALLSMGIDPMA